jgi:periplasmic divalent cation tolerance protein
MVELAPGVFVTEVVIILTSVPTGDQGETLARCLIDDRLAACVNLLAPMTSFYRWKGAVERDVERQLVVKTTWARVPEIRSRVAAMHSYELPEFLVLPVADGSPGYLEWVRSETVVRDAEDTR